MGEALGLHPRRWGGNAIPILRYGSTCREPYLSTWTISSWSRHEIDALWAAIASKVSFDEDQASIGKVLDAHHVFKQDGNYVHHLHRRDGGLHEGWGGDLHHGGRNFAPKRGEQAGEQSATCPSHLVKLLFAARLSRPDITMAITRLASKVSSWNTSHDRAPKRLMQYVATKPDLRLHSTLSTEDFADAQLVMSPDDGIAGDFETAKSTTDMILELRSRDGERS